MKTKIGIFDLTGCQGCEFHLLSANELLLDILQEFEITNWRLMTEQTPKDFDIAIIEGAATKKEHIELLKQIRATSRIVVALGACAITGNVFAELSHEKRAKLAPKIYDKNYRLKADFLEPIEKFIKIDEKIPGCPPDINAFKTFLTKIKGQTIQSPRQIVAPPDYTAKIEGHGTLKVDMEQRTASFHVEESERLIEGLLIGKSHSQAAFINSRVCGICPVSHNLCTWAAIENALKIKITRETLNLRELLMCGQIIKSHVLHLFFLVLPDYANLKGSLELSIKYPAEFHLMLNLKQVADDILTVIAGSSAFPTNTALGGFIVPPQIDKLSAIKEQIYDVLDEAEDLVKLFSELTYPKVETSLKFLTIASPKIKYPLYQSKTPAKIKEIIFNESTSKLGVLPNGETVKVGALARLASASARLNPMARRLFEKYAPNVNNPFSNNLAQAIETLHFLETSIKLIEHLEQGDLLQSAIQQPQKITRQQKGIASLEAPRGTLTHEILLNPDLTVARYNIIPPTQINLAALRVEADAFLAQNKNLSEEQTKRELEKLIRAFDPCITCAVH